MPTYEYRCSACDNLFEVFQSIKDDPIDNCPDCGGKANKLLSAGAGLIFKGSGFYITDYKNNNNNNNTKADKKADVSKDNKKEKAATNKTETSGSKPEKSKDKS